MSHVNTPWMAMTATPNMLTRVPAQRHDPFQEAFMEANQLGKGWEVAPPPPPSQLAPPLPPRGSGSLLPPVGAAIALPPPPHHRLRDLRGRRPTKVAPLAI